MPGTRISMLRPYSVFCSRVTLHRKEPGEFAFVGGDEEGMNVPVHPSYWRSGEPYIPVLKMLADK